MSILIKNMEMPTVPVLFCIHPDGKVFADLEGGWREYKAIPVPPHGRLIVLPVEIGTELYWVRSWGELCVEVGCVSMLQQKANKSWKIRISNNGSCFDVEQTEIGKSIFLTREEAEVALNEKTAKY